MRKVVVAGLIGMYALAARGEYEQINMTVFGMDCPPCAYAIRASMKGIQGVDAVSVDLNSGLVTVKLTPGNSADMRQFDEAVEKNGFIHKGSEVIVQGVLSGSAKALFLDVTGTKDRYALTPTASAVDMSALLGKKVVVAGTLPTTAKGKVAGNLLYKTISEAK
jgi:copper chaperone CopZ